MIQGRKVLSLSTSRIKKNEREPNRYYYDIRHSSDNEVEPIRLEPFVMVNFYGTLVFDEPIYFDENGFFQLTLSEIERVIELDLLEVKE